MPSLAVGLIARHTPSVHSSKAGSECLVSICCISSFKATNTMAMCSPAR